MSASFEPPLNEPTAATGDHASAFMRAWETEFTAPAILPHDASSKRVTAVIPAMNEAENLPHVLTRLPAIVDEVILVDGHSVDDTVEVARRLRPDIRVVTQTARGKGNALACGFAVATGDIIVMLDADGSTDPAEIPLFVAKLREGADFVKGSRAMLGGGSEDLTVLRRAGNRFLTGTVNTLYGVSYTDLCYGYMAFWRRCLPDLNVDCSGFEVETLLTVRAAQADLEIAEVPSVERNRIYGESNLRPVRDGMRVMRTILSERFGRREPKASWDMIASEIVHQHARAESGSAVPSHALERAV
jgi:glycosyltransferase involved in cell wall biosynthesis